MNLEELLNKLIQRGWKPRGSNEWKKIVKYGDWYNLHRYVKHIALPSRDLRLRNLVSKESGLWQFCVKNRLVKEDDGHITRIINLYKDDDSIVDGGWDYHYWLMICSILDDSELEQFLIENIKI